MTEKLNSLAKITAVMVLFIASLNLADSASDQSAQIATPSLSAQQTQNNIALQSSTLAQLDSQPYVYR
ncbi:MAG: hypothetical protein MI864_04815 [Pseudomonadales bacterium]|nr:hypothetical protein [Pseudomonadales bacterium]